MQKVSNAVFGSSVHVNRARVLGLPQMMIIVRRNRAKEIGASGPVLQMGRFALRVILYMFD